MSTDPANMPEGETVYERLTAHNSELRRRVDDLERELGRSEERFAWLQAIGAALADFAHPDEVVAELLERIPRAMDAERAALFLSEDDDVHFYARVPVDGVVREIRLRRGEGIAGWVAEHGRAVNVKDAYRDHRFSPEYDRLTGFLTRSVLCQPMWNKEGRIVGVLQVLNKRGGWFRVDDEGMLSAIANAVVIVLENKRLYLQTVDRNMELEQAQRQLRDRVLRIDTLYELQRRINEASDLDEVVGAIATGVTTAVPANACAISLVEGSRLTEYAFARSAGQKRLSPCARTWDASSRDEVLSSGRSVVCNGISDCLPAVSPAARSPEPSFTLHSVCIAPLMVDEQCIGAIELVNRRALNDDGNRAFSDADEKILSLVAAQISTVVFRSLTRSRQEHEQRLSAIGQMLSGVVHDMKTPLTIASGYLQLMERSDDPSRRADFAQRIKGQFEHIHGMTSELLSYARGETQLFLRTVHLHAFADEVRELLEQEFRESGVDVDVSADYRGDARFDDGKLKRVLFNLARNARQAMSEQGGHYHVRFERDDDELIILCEDDGPGIPEAIRGRIFEAFVSGNRAGGTGLGLAIVRKLVAEHGGTVTCESATGTGTTFRIALPMGAASTGSFPAATA